MRLTSLYLILHQNVDTYFTLIVNTLRPRGLHVSTVSSESLSTAI